MTVMLQYANNAYIARFSGHYLNGEMVIVAPTRRKAFNRAKKKIEDMHLMAKNEDFTIKDVQLIDLNIENVILIDNGDY